MSLKVSALFIYLCTERKGLIFARVLRAETFLLGTFSGDLGKTFSDQELRRRVQKKECVSVSTLER